MSVLLYDLVFGNYLNDITSILYYVEDRFRVENQLDNTVMLLLRFHYKAVLFRYEKENTRVNDPIIFLYKFLKSFDYDLLEYYVPGYRLSSQSVKKQSEVINREASPELVKKANKKKKHNKKGKNKEMKQIVQETNDVMLASDEVDTKSQSISVEKQLHI